MSSIVNNPAPVVNDNPILNRRSMISIGVMLVIWASLLFYALLKVWPRDHPDGRPIYFFSKIPFLQFQLESGSLDQRLIALVVIVGALGSFIHSATSFADYVGNRKFVESWTWWYLLRPFVGSALALALYFVVRAGLLGLRGGDGGTAESLSSYGVATLAAMSGLFSKQATDKLEEVFTTFFRPSPGKGDAKRGDKLDGPAVTAVTPTTGPQSGGTVVKITGTGFVEGATVTFGNVKAVAVVESPTSIKVTTPKHPPGSVAIAVKNPDNKEATASAQFVYTAEAAGGAGGAAALSVTGFAPPNGPHTGGTEVKVTGTGFAGNAIVKFGTAQVSAVVENATTLKVTTPAHDAGSVPVVVKNGDGKEVSASAQFTFDP